MHTQHNRPLYNKKKIIPIIIVSALVMVGLGVVASVLVQNRLTENVLEQYQRQEHLIANEVAQNLESNIESIREKLSLIASMPEVKTGDQATCTAKLQEVFAILDSKLGNLGRVDQNGIFRCSLNKALVGVDAKTLGDYIKQIINDPEHKPVLSRAIVPPGITTYVSGLHVPVFDQNQKFLGTVGGGVYFNELQEKYLQNITLAQNGYVVLLDDNGDILYHPTAELIGKNISQQEVKKRFSDSPAFDAAMAAAQQGKTGQLRYTFEGQEKVAVYRPAQVLPDHHWIVFITVPVQDAAAELSYIGLNTAFIWFVVILSLAAVTFVAMASLHRFQTYELQKSKDEFVSLASHQLRIPVTAVRNFIDLLMDGNRNMNPHQRELLEFARESNLRQVHIVANMLNVARLETGRLNLKMAPTDICKLSQTIVTNQQTLALERHQKLSITCQRPVIVVSADPAFLNIAINNLVVNACKFTPEAGKIEVTVGTRGRTAFIEIKDNGVGIAEKDMKKLFTKLGRITNELSEVSGGLGLGLYLSKKIIGLHKGNIIVSSHVAHGSTFTIELPLD